MALTENWFCATHKRNLSPYEDCPNGCKNPDAPSISKKAKPKVEEE